MFCTKCRVEIKEETNLCPQCGAKLESKQDAPVLYNEGYYYYTGTNGHPCDYTKALHYFMRAAALDYVNAINYVGIICLEGQGVVQNTKMAMYWFNRAISIDPSFGLGYYNLGRIYYGSYDIAKDCGKAYNCFANAIKYGQGQNYLGYAYHFIGCLLLIDYKKRKDSIDVFKKAIEINPNIVESWYNIGFAGEKEYGRGGGPSFEYTKYYKKAAQLGYAPAMDAMGRYCMKLAMNSSGKGIDFNVEMALEWFQAAIDKGYKKSKYNMAILKRWYYNATGNVSHTTSYISNTPKITEIESKPEKEFYFKDSQGRLVKSGDGALFYDFKGNLCKWGDPFYDSKGNYCRWGSPFYDGRDNYVRWGDPFYDADGNYIVP